jgi:hypothetical protein
MATRSAFNDDSYQMYRMDNVLDSVNLNVIGWNRATVADGQWLQDNAIGPLSARDMYLADCIDEAWGSINSIKQTLADMGAETTGVNLVGFTMKSLNVAQCNDPDAAYRPSNLGWDDKHTALVTTGAGDTFMTPASISLLTFGNQAHDITPLDQKLASEQFGGILQLNTTAKDAYQMAFTPDGIYYRHISPNDGQAQPQPGEKGDFTYMDGAPDFVALPLDAMTQSQADGRYAKLTDFGTYTGTTAPGQFAAKSDYNTYTATTAPGQFAAKSDYNTFTAKAIKTTDITTTSYNSQNYVIDISGMKVVSPTEIPAGGLLAVSHDGTLDGEGKSTSLLKVLYAPSATNAGNLSGAGGTSSYADITAAIGARLIAPGTPTDPNYYAYLGDHWQSFTPVDSLSISDELSGNGITTSLGLGEITLTSGGNQTKQSVTAWMQAIIDAIAAPQT